MTFSKYNHTLALQIVLNFFPGLIIILLIILHITTGLSVIWFYYIPFIFLFLKAEPFTKIEVTELFVREKGIFRQKKIDWREVRQVSLANGRATARFISEQQADDSFLYDGIRICIFKEKSPDPPDLSWKYSDYISFRFRPEAWSYMKEILLRNSQSQVITAAPIAKKG